MTGGGAPLAVLPGAAALVVLAFATDHPGAIAGVLVAGIALLFASRAPARLLLGAAIVAALATAVVNPLAGANGDLILIAGPRIGPLDLEVTLEEVAFGLLAGARLAAVMLVIGGALALVDPDRLHARAARVAPRSALLLALSTRLLPLLRRDGASLVEALRLRGARIAEGPARTRVREGGALVLPLVGSSLERGLDHAEALVARGYGAAPPSALPERPLTARERAAATVGLALAAAVLAATLSGGAGAMTWYPQLGRPDLRGALLGALAAASGLALARLLRRGRHG